MAYLQPSRYCLGIIIIIVVCIGLVRYSVSHDESFITNYG